MAQLDFRAISEARWLDRGRVTGYAKLLMLAWVGFLAVVLARFWARGSDFVAFWSAARLALEGRAATAYDIAALLAVQAQAGFPAGVPFINPPPYLLAVLPLGALDYPVALAIWLIGTFGLFALALRWLPREFYWPALAFPTVVVCGMAGQNGFLTSALLIGALGLQRDHKVLAGLLIGALVIKPHLALLLPVALIAGRDWKTFTVAGLTATGLLALSVFAFGSETLTAFLDSAAYSGSLLSGPSHIAHKTQSVLGLAVMVGASLALAAALQIVVASGAATAVFTLWRKTDDPLARAAIVCAATPLAVPYLFVYDLPFLVAPLVYLAREGVRRGFRPYERIGLLAAYLSPLAMFGLIGELALTPFVALGLSVFVAAAIRARSEVRHDPDAARSTVAAGPAGRP